MQLRHLVLAAVLVAALIPAAASAQSFHFGVYGTPSPRTIVIENDHRFGSDPLQTREDHLRDWMRRGSQEGWLTGWRAQRAWGEFRTIRNETYDGYDRHDAWRRLDRLTDIVRWSLDSARD